MTIKCSGVGSEPGMDNKEIASVWRRVADGHDEQSMRDARILKFASAWIHGFWSKIVCLCSLHIYAKHQIAGGKIVAKTPPYIAISISIIVTALPYLLRFRWC